MRGFRYIRGARTRDHGKLSRRAGTTRNIVLPPTPTPKCAIHTLDKTMMNYIISRRYLLVVNTAEGISRPCQASCANEAILAKSAREHARRPKELPSGALHDYVYQNRGRRLSGKWGGGFMNPRIESPPAVPVGVDKLSGPVRDSALQRLARRHPPPSVGRRNKLWGGPRCLGQIPGAPLTPKEAKEKQIEKRTSPHLSGRNSGDIKEMGEGPQIDQLLAGLPAKTAQRNTESRPTGSFR